MRRTLMVAILALALYAGICLTLFCFQRSLLYFPQPASLGASDTIAVLPIDDARVVMSVRPGSGNKAVVYFGGNGEDVTRSIAGLRAAFPAHALYLVHYRSYGGSTGQPSEAALVSDALAAIDEARRQHGEIEVVGRSLGSGIALHVATLRPVARLVLVTPYDSVQAIAAARFPFLPTAWLLRDKFESWRYAPAVTAPTVLIAADRDTVIPRASTERLLTHFRPGVATLSVIADAGHDSISQRPEYARLLGR